MVPKTARYQFRIIHALIGMSIAAVAMAVIVWPVTHVRSQSRDLNRLQQLVKRKGGYVDVQDGLVVGVQLDGVGIVDEDLAEINWRRLDTLRWVVLRSPGLTDKSVRVMCLAESPGLGYIDVKESQITLEATRQLWDVHRCWCVHNDGVIDSTSNRTPGSQFPRPIVGPPGPRSIP